MVTTGGKSRFSPQSSLRCNGTENNRGEQCFVTILPCSWHMNERQRNSALAYFPICKVKGETGLGEVTMVGGLWVGWRGGQRSEDGSCVFPGGVSNRNQHRGRGWDATRWPLLEQKSERGQWQGKNSSYLMFSPWKSFTQRGHVFWILLFHEHQVMLTSYGVAILECQGICWPDFWTTIASFSKSRESRTKVTLDHRVSLPETEAGTCSVSSPSVKKLPVRTASSTERCQECPLIPFTGANGFKILTLHPESGELHPWS